jgi:hypothetical protein
VLDHAAAIDEIELRVGERQALGGIGLYERARVGGTGRDVEARDVECGLQRAQAQASAADVQDARLGGHAGEREEVLVSASAGARGER